MRFWIILFLLLTAFTANAEVLVVGPGAQFETIGVAINAAVPGDIIRVQAGIYNENLLVNRSVTIEGDGSPTVKGVGKGSVIDIVSDNTIIRGLKIETSGGDLVAEDAGIHIRSNGNTIEDTELSDVLFGIYLYHSSNNNIRRNRIHGRPELESGSRGGGIHLWNSTRNVLEDNTISETRDGMYIQNSSDNIFRRNRVFDLRYGLHFMSSDNNTFEDNVFFDNIAGAAIMYSQNIELKRNTFVHNRGFSSFGILFQDCRQCKIEENLVIDNAVGLFLEGTRDSVFSRNTVAENDVALQIFTSSDRNIFTRNNFINNLSPLQLVGRDSSTQWQSEEGGNYWSDYDGYDMDGDGIGDVQHRVHNIFEFLEGNYPRLRIYLNSPAAQSIVAAEKSFPVLAGSKEFDSRPLMRPVRTTIVFAPQDVGKSAARCMVVFSVFLLVVSAFMFTRGYIR